AETTVRQYVRARRRAMGLAVSEVFVPQVHAPGMEGEVDWGAVGLARQAAGFPGAFGIRLNRDAQAIAYKALAEFDGFATHQFDSLPLPTRAATLGYLYSRRAFATRAAKKRAQDQSQEGGAGDGFERVPGLPARSEELDEFIELFYPKPIDPPTEHVFWEEQQEAERARCRLIAQRLASEGEWVEHVGRWETWAQQTSELFNQGSGYALGVVLTEVARLKPRRAIAIIDQLIETESPLRTQSGRAINYLVAQGKAGPTVLNRWSHSDETTRATLANAIAELETPHVVRTFQRLSRDESAIVRRGALSGLRYGNTTTDWRISIGLRIAQELADINAIELVLEMVEAADVTLTSELARQAADALQATAGSERVDVHDLERAIRRLEPVTGDLTLQWVWRRIDWLENTNQRGWMLDVLPDVLADRVHEHATHADMDAALQRLQSVDTTLLAFDGLITLLNWIDPGASEITDLIVRLHDEPDGVPRARSLLRLELSWDECRSRVEVLAERLDPEVTTTLIDNMLPTTWTSGTYGPYVADALDHVIAWADEAKPGLFLDALRTSIATLDRTLTRTHANDNRQDDVTSVVGM
ncbi:MAG: hypothetical protein ACLP22_12320, partial [Solirubrobacteraceae bacterium]